MIRVLSGRHLASRQLHPVMRSQLPYLHSHVRRNQVIRFDAEHARDEKQFEVGNSTTLVFEFGD